MHDWKLSKRERESLGCQAASESVGLSGLGYFSPQTRKTESLIFLYVIQFDKIRTPDLVAAVTIGPPGARIAAPGQLAQLRRDLGTIDPAAPETLGNRIGIIGVCNAVTKSQSGPRIAISYHCDFVTPALQEIALCAIATLMISRGLPDPPAAHPATGGTGPPCAQLSTNRIL